MVIGLMTKNRHGAIHLLGKEQANHLMAESHFRQRNLGIGT